MPGDIPNWIGWVDIGGSLFPQGMGTGQFIDLSMSVDGFMQQTVTLTEAGPYVLAFKQKAHDNNYTSYKAQISWNSINVHQTQPSTLEVTQEFIWVDGIVGLNVVKFE